MIVVTLLTVGFRMSLLWNENTKAWELEKTQYNLYIGDSSREEDLQKLSISF